MDKISTQRRSENMRHIRSTDMAPELIVRRLVHRLGYRYRLHKPGLPGKPDLVFASQGKIIFVHGCFWHQHASKRCRITRQPKSNTGYWLEKLQRNVKRDRSNLRSLRREGWSVLVIWECETKNHSRLIDRVSSFLSVLPPIRLRLKT